MRLGRRELIAGALGLTAGWEAKAAPEQESRSMYGLIGKMIAAAGQRDALIGILLEGSASMPGCLSYVVAKDSADANAVWVTEVWDSQASHDASLGLPQVKKAIAAARPIIAGFGERFITTPAGGYGLASPPRG